ncbi:MAG: hypothetical protein WD055_03355 [Candidatus Dependentiae bacterium]
MIKQFFIFYVCLFSSFMYTADIPSGSVLDDMEAPFVDSPFNRDYAMVPFQGRYESLLDIIRLAQSSECPDHLKDIWLNMKRVHFFNKTVLWKEKDQRFYNLNDPCITINDIRMIPTGQIILCNLFRYLPERNWAQQIDLAEINEMDKKKWQEKNWVFLKDVSSYSSFSSFQKVDAQEGDDIVQCLEGFEEPVSYVVLGTKDKGLITGSLSYPYGLNH